MAKIIAKKSKLKTFYFGMAGLFLLLLFVVIYFFVISLEHPHTYDSARRQCGNIERVIHSLNTYHSEFGVYPKTLDEVEGSEFWITLYDFQPPREGLNQYEYENKVETFKVEFLGPSGKKYQVAGLSELELVCTDLSEL